MQIVYGNMWDEIGKADLFCVTVNGTVYSNNGTTDRLVMGAGIAGQVEKRIPSAPFIFGQHIAFFGNPVGVHRGATLFDFGIARPALFVRQGKSTEVAPVARHEMGTKGTTEIVGFQVKHFFNDRADLGLVEKSVALLSKIAPTYDRIVLNFPAIGYGGRDPEHVMPLLETLPDNVVVYRYIDDQRIVDV